MQENLTENSVSVQKAKASSWLVGLFARETSGGAFVPVVDGLRFVAIAWVVLYHISGYVAEKLYNANGHVIQGLSGDSVYRFSSVGFFGVQLFFVISGYILALPFARQHLVEGAKKVSLWQYFVRRVTRLEPPYVLNLVILFVLLLMVKGGDPLALLKHLFASMFYVHGVVYGEPSVINGVAWSLELEVQFYILAPILTMVFIIRQIWLRRGVLIAAIVGMACLQEFAGLPLWKGFALWNQLHYFLVGLLLAEFSLTSWKGKTPNVLWDVLGSVGWVGMFASILWFIRPGTEVHGFGVHLASCGAIVLAYCGAFRGKALSWLFSRPMLYLIGGACYTLYLWHYVVISAVGRVIQRFVPSSGEVGLDILVYTALLTPAILGVGAVFFLLVEKPCMRRDWPQRVWRKVFGGKAPSPRS
jgi:peptidoglycan/LPS O-acetylase OafA/YrhL